MKKIFLALMLIAVPAAAKTIATPAYLKDAKIVVTLADGKKYTFSSNDFAVVPRVTPDKEVVVVPLVAEKTPAEAPLKAKPVEGINQTVVRNKKHRLHILAGRGPDGVALSSDPDTFTLKQKYRAVGGLGYDYLMENDISVGATGMTNGTVTLDLGLDF